MTNHLSFGDPVHPFSWKFRSRHGFHRPVVHRSNSDADKFLDGPTSLSDAAAESLRRHEGFLFLELHNLPPRPTPGGVVRIWRIERRGWGGETGRSWIIE